MMTGSCGVIISLSNSLYHTGVSFVVYIDGGDSEYHCSLSAFYIECFSRSFTKS